MARPSVYKGADGWWHAYATVGQKPDGHLDRRHLRGRTRQTVVDKLDALEGRARAGSVPKPGAGDSLAQWLRHYLEHIVKPNKPQTTWRGYRSLFEQWVIPRLGQRRLVGNRNILQPEDLDTLYTTMRRAGGRTGKGMADSSIVKTHRILSKALALAVRYDRATRNVCDLVNAPTARKTQPKGYSLEHGQALLAAAAGDRLEARWQIGLLLGPRQGEALGIRWPHVDLTAQAADGTPTPRIDLQRQIQRGTWQHGCADPGACAALRCRTKRCGPSWEHGCDEPGECRANPRCCPQRRQVSCRRHTRACPEPCPPGCVQHAMHCPQRVDGGLVEVDLKSERSERPLFPPPQTVDALQRWRQTQMRECHARGARWDPDGLVFTTPDGTPVDPRHDHDAWKDLARRAGVPVKQLHAARHTAATLLSATGAAITTVQDTLGHTDIRTARGYVGPAEELQREAVVRLAEAMFAGNLARLVQGAGTTR